MSNRLRAPAGSSVARDSVEGRARPGRVEVPLVIYGGLAGCLAVGLGYLAFRLLGTPGVIVGVAFVALAGWLADPILDRIRSSSGSV
jgi:hypothetical protein